MTNIEKWQDSGNSIVILNNLKNNLKFEQFVNVNSLEIILKYFYWANNWLKKPNYCLTFQIFNFRAERHRGVPREEKTLQQILI